MYFQQTKPLAVRLTISFSDQLQWFQIWLAENIILNLCGMSEFSKIIWNTNCFFRLGVYWIMRYVIQYSFMADKQTVKCLFSNRVTPYQNF